MADDISITVISDLPEVGARIARAGAAAPEIASSRMLETAEAVKEAAIPVMAGLTPRRSGTLADSTMGEVEAAGEGAEIRIRQPATNADGTEYVQWVVLGRGDVYPVNKKALAGPNFGPVAHAGPAAPNPYPDEFAAAFSDEFAATLDRSGLEIADAIIAVMR